MMLRLNGALCVLLLLFPAQGAGVSLFGVSPASPCAGEAVEVAAGVSAAEREPHRLAVEFLSRAGGAWRLDFGEMGGPAALVASWVPTGAGSWTARTSPPGGEARFEVRECASAPEGRASAGFSLWPRWVELSPGDGTVLDLVVASPPGSLTAELGGPAARWAAVSPREVGAEAARPAALTLALQAPEDAPTGRTTLTLSVGPDSLTLPVVVKASPTKLPVVLRSVAQRGNSTEVSLRVANGNHSTPRLGVLEAVEPSLAPTSADLGFSGSPPEFLNESPALLRWLLEDVLAGEERVLSYRVDRALPAGLPAWPVRQVNVVPRTGAGAAALQLLRLEADAMVSGRPGEVRAEVRNLLPEPFVVEAVLAMPHGWSVREPQRAALVPGGSANLTLSAAPPLFSSGSAVGTLRLKAGEHSLERSFAVTVSQDAGPVAIAVVAVLASMGFLWLRGRFRTSRKRETLFQLKEMRRRLR
ncbi:MAG: hypothetical protein QXT68_04465 [Halobacteria archaeon]